MWTWLPLDITVYLTAYINFHVWHILDCLTLRQKFWIDPVLNGSSDYSKAATDNRNRAVEQSSQGWTDIYLLWDSTAHQQKISVFFIDFLLNILHFNAIHRRFSLFYQWILGIVGIVWIWENFTVKNRSCWKQQSQIIRIIMTSYMTRWIYMNHWLNYISRSSLAFYTFWRYNSIIIPAFKKWERCRKKEKKKFHLLVCFGHFIIIVKSKTQYWVKQNVVHACHLWYTFQSFFSFLSHWLEILHL